MSSIICFVKKAFSWIKLNFKWVLCGLAGLLLFVLLFSWYSKNKKIRSLKNQLIVLQTKFQLEKLAAKNDCSLNELKKLKEEDSKIRSELARIESSLKDKVESNISLEEIKKKFEVFNT